MFRTFCHVLGDPSCCQARPPVLRVPVFQWLVPGETYSETGLGSVQTADQVFKLFDVLLLLVQNLTALLQIKPNLFHFPGDPGWTLWTLTSLLQVLPPSRTCTPLFWASTKLCPLETVCSAAGSCYHCRGGTVLPWGWPFLENMWGCWGHWESP